MCMRNDRLSLSRFSSRFRFFHCENAAASELELDDVDDSVFDESSVWLDTEEFDDRELWLTLRCNRRCCGRTITGGWNYV